MSQTAASLVSSNGFEYGVKHFYNQTPGYLTEILFATLGLSNETTLDLLKLGAIYVNNQRQTLDTELSLNQLCRVHTKPRRYDCQLTWKNFIIYENQDFLVLNKPSGIPSHPSVDNILENSLTQTSLALNQQLLITHRLDTLTSGLIVYAKNNEFVKNFNMQIQNRGVEKKYVALVESTQSFSRQQIHYMEPSPRAPKKVSAVFVDKWTFCELEILAQKKYSLYSWLKINLLTGRTHQIRSQLAQLNAPIRGDTLYGSQMSYQNNAIALRACELQFNWGSQRLVFNLAEDFDNC